MYKQFRQVVKYGDNMSSVLKKSVCSSIQIKRVLKGQFLIIDQKKDNEFYCILLGDAFILEQKNREFIQEEMDTMRRVEVILNEGDKSIDIKNIAKTSKSRQGLSLV